MRHQAFESEIKSNKDRLEKLITEANELIEQKPELAKVGGVYSVIAKLDINYLKITV